jgi:hypothetical protein
MQLKDSHKTLIYVHKMSNRTKRETGVLTVTAAGNFLMLMIIFKSKPNGRIAKTELKTIDPTSVSACQVAAWMDEQCMLMWVEQIFAPYLLANRLPSGIQPVILLDAYQCLMMQLVVLVIAALGVEVIHIPGRWTGLCQPLNVGIIKPFKHCCV